MRYQDWLHEVLEIFEIHISGSNKWRSDHRCGPRYPLSDGSKAECNPLGIFPCCSTAGWCGKTPAHCTCNGCIWYKPKPQGLPLLINVIVTLSIDETFYTPVRQIIQLVNAEPDTINAKPTVQIILWSMCWTMFNSDEMNNDVALTS